MSVRRPRRLRLETIEDRAVPSVSIGANVDSLGSASVPALGNSGAVGPNHFVQFQTGNFLVFDKAGNELAAKADSTFWTDAGLGFTQMVTGVAQPRVTYDVLTDRWFAVEINLNATNNEVFVARSDTADPTGTWTALSYVGIATQFANFPTLGVDAHGVYVGTGNFVNRDTPTVTGSTLTAIPKADLLAATPTLANAVTFDQSGAAVPMGWAPQVVTNFDPNPARATVVATHFTAFNRIVVTPLTWTGSTFALGTSQNITTLKTTSLPGKSRQPDGTRQLSGGDDDRYAGAIYQVGNLIYAAHPISVTSAGVAPTGGLPTSTSRNAVHLVVLDAATNAIVAETTYWSATFDYAFASVAANPAGDIIMGVNRSSLSVADGQVGAYVVHGRLDLSNPDRLQRITWDQELEVMAGQTDGYHQQAASVESWGPYSSTVIDPTNPYRFWTTQMYALTDTAWATRVAEVTMGVNAVGADTTAADGTYGVGAVIPVQVTFDGAVNVTGAPRLRLNSGGSAVYTGGTGTTTLTFTYTVGAGDAAADLDYQSATPFDLTGGATITDAATGAPAGLSLPGPGSPGSLGHNANVVIDTSGVGVTGVSSTAANGTYGFGAVIPITVTFSGPVTVAGVPTLALNTGGSASYAGGSGSATLTFNYTVGANHVVADLDYTAAGIALNGGSITDQASGTAADLTRPAPGAAGSLGANKEIAVDARPARATGVTAGVPNGTYGLGAPITVRVTFTQPVAVAGVPQLALNTGGAATYTGGSGTDTLTFTYTVGAGHQSPDLDYISANALTGGTITDQGSGAAATTTLPFPGAPGSLGANADIVVDTNTPVVTGVTSTTPDGTYGVGAVINVTVTYSRPVDVAGTPELALNSGGTADYVSGSGTTALTFQYTVASGDTAADLDYASATALSLGGGTIQSTANGQAADLTLPARGGAGSLGAAGNLVVDGKAPTVVDFRVLYGNRWYSMTNGAPRDVLPWLITGVRVVFDEPVTTGRAASLTGLTAQRVTGVKTNTLTWRFRGVGRGAFNFGFSTAAANLLKDRSGNPVNGFTQQVEVLWGDFNDDRVVDARDTDAVRAAQAGPYQGSAGSNPFADLSGDGLVNLVDVGITRSRRGTFLA